MIFESALAIFWARWSKEQTQPTQVPNIPPQDSLEESSPLQLPRRSSWPVRIAEAVRILVSGEIGEKSILIRGQTIGRDGIVLRRSLMKSTWLMSTGHS